jgi:MFS family permease
MLRMDLSPLRGAADFRWLLCSRTVTLLGTEASAVALLVQARQLTGSALAVGLLGVAELVPLMAFGLYGGVLADRLDRGMLLRWGEAGLGVLAALLLLNALLTRPAVWPLYLLAAAMTALSALQRPSFDAAVPRTVPRDQLAAAAGLLGVTTNASVLLGTALGGALAAAVGPQLVYGFDTASFAVSFIVLSRLRRLPPPAAGPDGPAGPVPQGARPPGLGVRGVLAGLDYARRRPELLGSYLADLAAMILAYPIALFPFLAVTLHAPWSVGLMFAAPSAGALAASAVSGWTSRVHRHGVAIALAAAGWGVAITAFGFAPDVAAALACLLAAGAADEISAIFRSTLWNQTIPDVLRGRLAGVEMLSYSIGPSAGQLRAGGVASVTSPRVAAWSGGLLCVGAVGLVCLALPGFTRYSNRASLSAAAAGPAATGPAPAVPPR